MLHGKLLDAKLSSKRGKWRDKGDTTESADEAFRAVRPSVISRDGGACSFCGIVLRNGKGLIEVHHRDDCHENNALDNLASACKLDHALHHPGFYGDKARMCHIPEISMRDMSHLVRTMLVAMASEDEVMKASAQEIYNALLPGCESFAKAWHSDNPADFGNALLTLSNFEYENREPSLEGVRFLPDIHNESWIEWGGGVRDNAYKALPENVWPDIADSALPPLNSLLDVVDDSGGNHGHDGGSEVE